MRKLRVITILVILSMVLSLGLSSCKPAAAASKEPVELVVFWHSGGLGDYLVDIAKQYTAETGVVIRGEFVPYGPQWHDKIAADFAAKSSAVDLTVFDSQSMSEFASGGHVVKLNDLLDKSTKVKAADFVPLALKTYAEYPEGSGDLYALPVNQDSMGLAYRKDLFEDPKEKEAFKAKYGYELAPPTTYTQLKDIAEFFTRPEQNLYGIATYGSRDYDAVTSPFDGVLWSFGGELWDPAKYTAEGVINSQTAITACQYYVDLFKYGPPGMSGWFYDEVNNAFHNGLTAMSINWYYFFHSDTDPKSNPNYYDKVGFTVLPGETGPDGTFRQFQSVGGQGLGISKYSKHQEEAWKFIEWFMTKDIQWQWVKVGAQTGRADILNSPDYTTATKFNDSFPTAMGTVKDYWHLSEYPQLLDIYQKNMNLAVTGAVDCKTALDNTAKEQQPIFDGIKK